MSFAAAIQRIETEAARFGFVRKRGGGHDRHKACWELKCSKCPVEFHAYWPPQIPPEQMVKNMRVRRWDVGQGMRPLCPVCAHPSKNKAPLSKPEWQNFTPHIEPLPQTALTTALVSAGVKLVSKPQPQLPSFEEYKAKLTVPFGDYNAGAAPPPTLGILANAERNTRLDAAADTLVAAIQGVEAAEENVKLADIERRALMQKAASLAREAKAIKVAERRERKAAAVAEARKIVEAHRAAIAPTQPVTISEKIMNTTSQAPAFVKPPTPSPKISHAVFQTLDSIFDSEKRLYRNGYTDQRVAKECGTSEDVVAYLRYETFGALAEDPRISAIRDDVELAKMELAELVKNWDAKLKAFDSRIEQVAANTGRK